MVVVLGERNEKQQKVRRAQRPDNRHHLPLSLNQAPLLQVHYSIQDLRLLAA